jgi:hypothetical protein
VEKGLKHFQNLESLEINGANQWQSKHTVASWLELLQIESHALSTQIK